ncbi:MAG: hypothetical protein WCQ95_01760 [Bacteroidota bacterium]
MSNYYCHQCAEILGFLPANNVLNYTGSAVQLDKFIKHTMPTASYKINSIFQSNDYVQYKDYMVNSICSGSVEIDNFGRMNIVWIAGEKTGATYITGSFITDNNSVKVVKSWDCNEIHGYPTSSDDLELKICSNCGRNAVK